MKIHEDGTEEVAIEVSDSEVRVKTRLMRQYQAARQLDLPLFIGSVRHASSEEVVLPEDESWKDEWLCAERYTNTMMPSPLTGHLATRVTAPPLFERCGMWPYEEKDDYFPDFVIGYDDEGEEIRYSCNPDALANYSTPVHFRREVLQKYHDHPEKYGVEDGYLRYSGLWGLRAKCMKIEPRRRHGFPATATVAAKFLRY